MKVFSEFLMNSWYIPKIGAFVWNGAKVNIRELLFYFNSLKKKYNFFSGIELIEQPGSIFLDDSLLEVYLPEWKPFKRFNYGEEIKLHWWLAIRRFNYLNYSLTGDALTVYLDDMPIWSFNYLNGSLSAWCRLISLNIIAYLRPELLEWQPICMMQAHLLEC